MPPAVDVLRFVVDENLLRLGRALSVLRSDLACVGRPPIDELLPSGIADSAWIPIVGVRGWVMITNDKRLRTRPPEAKLAIANRLMVIHLLGAGQLRGWNQAERLLSRWAAIEKHIAATPEGPWWLSVRAQGIRVLSFRPGEPERG